MIIWTKNKKPLVSIELYEIYKDIQIKLHPVQNQISNKNVYDLLKKYPTKLNNNNNNNSNGLKRKAKQVEYLKLFEKKIIGQKDMTKLKFLTLPQLKQLSHSKQITYNPKIKKQHLISMLINNHNNNNYNNNHARNIHNNNNNDNNNSLQYQNIPSLEIFSH